MDHNQFTYLAERSVKDALLTMINNVYEQLEANAKGNAMQLKAMLKSCTI